MKGNDIKIGSKHHFRWIGNDLIGKAVQRRPGEVLMAVGEEHHVFSVWVFNEAVKKKVRKV